jgi:hypothetical protein
MCLGADFVAQKHDRLGENIIPVEASNFANELPSQKISMSLSNSICSSSADMAGLLYIFANTKRPRGV